jgi:alkylhydroperoxidase family enzyme
MSRINVVDPKAATGAARTLLDAVQSQLGVTPNVFRVLANSPKALEGFLSLYGAAAGFALDKATQERSRSRRRSNSCNTARPTTIGRGAGLTNDECCSTARVRRVMHGRRPVALAKALNENVGEVTTAELDAARAAGLTDAHIVEVIAVVVLNIFTNIINKASRVEIDFPKVALLEPQLRAAA